MSEARLASAGWAALVLVGVVFPLTQPPQVTVLATLALSYAIAIVGINLLTGFAGQVSFAQSLFVAVGAYLTAILVQRYGWPFLATLPVVLAANFALGVLLGVPAVRLSGLYLAVATFSVALLVPPLIIRLDRWTGGANGLAIGRKMVPAEGLSPDQWKYYIALALTAVAFYAARNIHVSQLGRALISMSANELVATTLGVNGVRLKVLAFAWSAMFAGIAGSLMALVDEFVAPQSFSFILSILLLVGAVVGGILSTLGALIGAVVLVALQYYTDQAGLGWVGVLYGAAVVAVVLVAPNGITGLLKAGVSRLLPRKAGQAPSPRRT